MLLQDSPLDDVVRRLTNLFYLVMLIGAAILPAIRQARERKRRERAEQEGGATLASPEPSREPVPEPSLEEKLRRYFEERAKEEPPSAAERPPPRRRPAVAQQRPRPSSAPRGRLVAAPDLGELGRRRRQERLRERRDQTPGQRRQRMGRTASRLRRLLSDRRSVRSAIAAAEILAPPRALRDPGATGRPPADL